MSAPAGPGGGLRREHRVAADERALARQQADAQPGARGLEDLREFGFELKNKYFSELGHDCPADTSEHTNVHPHPGGG